MKRFIYLYSYLYKYIYTLQLYLILQWAAAQHNFVAFPCTVGISFSVVEIVTVILGSETAIVGRQAIVPL